MTDATAALARVLGLRDFYPKDADEFAAALAAEGYVVVPIAKDAHGRPTYFHDLVKPYLEAAEAADREAVGRIEHGHDQPALDAASLSSAAADPLICADCGGVGFRFGSDGLLHDKLTLRTHPFRIAAAQEGE